MSFWKRERKKQSESEKGGMRDLRERLEFCEVGKHSRGKTLQLIFVERLLKEREGESE